MTCARHRLANPIGIFASCGEYLGVGTYPTKFGICPAKSAKLALVCDLVRWAIGSRGSREGGISVLCAAATGTRGDGWTSTLGGVAAVNVIRRGVTGVGSHGGRGRSWEAAGGGGNQDGQGVMDTLGAGACCGTVSGGLITLGRPGAGAR